MKDLQLLRGMPPTATALEAALRLTDQKSVPPTPAAVREIDRYFTADSDPSQEAAVIEARQAPGLVIEGPPGTGKSQTIVNMVADAIGRGKSLLVICQKQPAIDVVRKRLEREQLGDRFVMITDATRDRGAIVAVGVPFTFAVLEMVSKIAEERTWDCSPTGSLSALYWSSRTTSTGSSSGLSKS